MAKIHWDKLSLKEAINLAKARGDTIQKMLTSEINNASKVRKLEAQLLDADIRITELSDDLIIKDEKIASLRDMLSENGGECTCEDWISAGTNPNTWDKLKQCLDCGKISVR